MYKTLIKKQLAELNSFYYNNRKTGMRRSKAGIVGCIILYSLLFLFLAVMFAGFAFLVCDTLTEMKLDWVYFAMFSIMAILLGTFGSVFNTFASLYKAKDNELLLSLPVTPSAIIISRLIGVYAMSLLYSSLVWIPAVIVYWIEAAPSVLSVVYSILLMFVITFLVLVLTCILGWVVAVISVKLKYKKLLSLAASLIFFGAYYWVCFNMNTFIEQFLLNGAKMSDGIRNNLYPVYLLGRAAAGDTVSMIIFTAAVAVLTALCYLVMIRTFTSLVTKTPKETRVEYKETALKSTSVKKALFSRELKLLTSSTTYMMNTCLGMVMMPVIAVVLFIKRAQIPYIFTVFNLIEQIKDPVSFLTVMFTVLLFALICMDAVTAPSISLEGKNIWILQTLPVSPYEILKAKEQLHFRLNVFPACILAGAAGYLLGLGVLNTVLIIALSVLYILFIADTGLWLNLLKPNLNWTNEVVPIKQSMPIMILLFGGWVFAVILGGIFFMLQLKFAVSGSTYLICVAVVLVILIRVFDHWFKTKGSSIFATLS